MAESSRIAFPALTVIFLSLIGCSDAGAPTEPSHEGPLPDILAAVEALEASGSALGARAVTADGRASIVAAAPVTRGAATAAASAVRGESQPPDAPPEELFFIQNPADGDYTLSDGTPVFYTEHRPDGVTGIFQFFCIVNQVPIQLLEVTVDSITQDRVPDTGGHIDAQHTGEPLVGSWDDFDPEDGVVRNGLFQARYTTNEASQDEDMRFYYTVDEQGSPCFGDKVVVPLKTATRLLDASGAVASLIRIPDTAELYFDAITSGHSDPYFLLQDVIDRLDAAAAALATQTVPAQFGSGTYDSLRVNSGSLLFGGLYAVCSSPTPYDVIACGGHSSHRIGTDVDLDWREDDAGVWNQIIKAGVRAGFRKCDVHNNNHIHCFGNSRPYTQ